MNVEQLREATFAMPFNSPSYPRGPYRYIGREYMTITYRSTIEAVRKVVPEPLIADEPLVHLEFVRMPDSTGFGAYSGAAQVIPVRLGDETGGYTRLMFSTAILRFRAGGSYGVSRRSSRHRGWWWSVTIW